MGRTGQKERSPPVVTLIISGHLRTLFADDPGLHLRNVGACHGSTSAGLYDSTTLQVNSLATTLFLYTLGG